VHGRPCKSGCRRTAAQHRPATDAAPRSRHSPTHNLRLAALQPPFGPVVIAIFCATRTPAASRSHCLGRRALSPCGLSQGDRAAAGRTRLDDAIVPPRRPHRPHLCSPHASGLQWAAASRRRRRAGRRAQGGELYPYGQWDLTRGRRSAAPRAEGPDLMQHVVGNHTSQDARCNLRTFGASAEGLTGITPARCTKSALDLIVHQSMRGGVRSLMLRLRCSADYC